MKRCLITGCAGSGASYLGEYLVENNLCEVHGTVRWHSTGRNTNLDNIKDKIKLHECDLTDFSATYKVLNEVKPDYIFHMASHANVNVCFKSPIAVFNNNVNSTLNLFEIIHLLKLDPIVQLCSTSEVYGNVLPENVPITENNELNPVNIYAVSKLTQEKIANSYQQCYGIRTIISRAFSYVNPRRRDIVLSSFANQIARVETGKQEILYHGNLESIRAFCDVRDIMEAYWILSQTEKYGEVFHIGGTESHTIEELLCLMLDKCNTNIIAKQDPLLIRPRDVTLQIPSVGKFVKLTGWKPKISLDESLDWLLDYYRKENE